MIPDIQRRLSSAACAANFGAQMSVKVPFPAHLQLAHRLGLSTFWPNVLVVFVKGLGTFNSLFSL